MSQKKGFTLIELLITIMIVVLLTVIGVFAFTRVRGQSKISRVSAELTTLATAMTQYAEDNDYTYPGDVDRGMPPGLEKYLPNNKWPESIWPNGVFDYDAWPRNGQQVYQISYRLCDLADPISECSDPQLFPNFVRNSSIYYCISGPCVPHRDTPTVPGYCVNCKPREQNY